MRWGDGIRFHARLVKLGLDADPFTAARLLKSYAANPSEGSLLSARRLFDQTPHKDVVLWTAMVAACARSPNPAEALRLLSQMHRGHGAPSPNHYTYASAARAAGSAVDQRMAVALHAQALKDGFLPHVVVETSILDMYSKCRDLGSARRMFDEMPARNTVTWNSLIAGYTAECMGWSVLSLFNEMKNVEFEHVDEFTVASVVTACAGIGELFLGVQVHCFSIKAGFGEDMAIRRALANMYFRCGEVKMAEQTMEKKNLDVFSTLVMIKGYPFNGRFLELMRIVKHCNFVEVIRTDPSAIVSVLVACANLSLLAAGRQTHGVIVTLGLCHKFVCPVHFDDVVIGSALIEMYSRCFCIEEAWKSFNALISKDISHWNSMINGCLQNHLIEEALQLFTRMPEKNVVSWTAMITGYIHHGFPMEGLKLLRNMYIERGPLQGNMFTFVAGLNASSCLADLDLGKQIHGQVVRRIAAAEIDGTIVLETALLDMYAKSGNLYYARKLFDRMKKRNVVAWSSMVTSYAVHGMGFQAIEIFEEMLMIGFKPNEVTFVAILNACSHCGLVEEGIRYFKLMTDIYGIVPRGDHYTCMVDMLGRAGRLAEAWTYAAKIKDAERGYNKDKSNHESHDYIWGALLGNCSLHSSINIGSKVASRMLKLNPELSDVYVAMSNIYAEGKMWDDAYELRDRWRCKHVEKKAPGISHIQITTAN